MKNKSSDNQAVETIFKLLNDTSSIDTLLDSSPELFNETFFALLRKLIQDAREKDDIRSAMRFSALAQIIRISMELKGIAPQDESWWKELEVKMEPIMAPPSGPGEAQIPPVVTLRSGPIEIGPIESGYIESGYSGYIEAQIPPVVAPPPRLLRWRVIAIFIGIGLLVGLSLLFNWQGSARLLFVSQMLLLIIAICLTPTAAHHLTKRQGRIARVVVETLLFIVSFIAFGYWLIGGTVFGIWIAYAAVLVLLLEIGAHFVDYHKIVTLKRLSRSVSFKHVQSNAEALEKLFHSELVLYVSVPLGLTAGTTIGLVRGQTPGVVLVLCIQIVLLLASLVLLFFLVKSFAQMRDPLFKTTQTYSPKIANEWMVERKGFIHKIGRVLRFLVPSPKPETVDQEQKDLDLACMVADLRKVYLYDAVHNVILLVAFTATVIGLWGIHIDVRWLIASLIGMSLLFNQLPFVLGQSALHEKVLERYEGTKRADIAEKLKKYSPLFPTSDFLAALFTTGTAGGVLYVLLDNFIKEALK